MGRYDERETRGQLLTSPFELDRCIWTDLEVVSSHDLPVGLGGIRNISLGLLVEHPLELDRGGALLASLAGEVDLALLERGDDELVQPERGGSIEERVLSVESGSTRGENDDYNKPSRV